MDKACPLQVISGTPFCRFHQDNTYEAPESESLLEEYRYLLSIYRHCKAPAHGYRFRNLTTSPVRQVCTQQLAFQACQFYNTIYNHDFFEQVDFLSCQFEKSRLQTCAIDEFSFEGADISDVELHSSSLINGNMIGSQVRSEGLKFENCTLKNIMFTGNHWKSVQFYNCDLNQVLFSDNQMDQVSFYHCDLSRVQFETNLGMTAMESTKIIHSYLQPESDDFLLSRVNCSERYPANKTK